MTKAIFNHNDGSRQVVDAPAGWSLMQAARQSGVQGIPAECGGGAMCSTCHVLIKEDWWDRVGAADFVEDGLLTIAPERGATSRLSCQVTLTEELDGVEVTVPSEQADYF